MNEIELLSPVGLLMVLMAATCIALGVSNLSLVDKLNNRNRAFRWLEEHRHISGAVLNKARKLAEGEDDGYL